MTTQANSTNATADSTSTATATTDSTTATNATAHATDSTSTTSATTATDADSTDSSATNSTTTFHTYLLTVAYDGRAFSGFAHQKNARTVAGELLGAVRELDPHVKSVRGVSRTDAGVHAHCQRVAFDTTKDLAPRNWAHAVTRHLPDEISIVGAARVDAGYDPRAHARFKRYRYVLLESETRDPFHLGRAWRLRYRLNQQLLREELELIVGRHDFAAFRGAADQRSDTVREILRTTVRNDCRDARLTQIEIEGDRFMYNMVRIIVGTVVDVARGKLQPGATQRALRSLRRTDLGITAPPDGLYLDWVELDDAGRDVWPEDCSRLTAGPTVA